MGLVVYWYDFICFGIVGVAFLGSIYVIWRNESGFKKVLEGKLCPKSFTMMANPPDSIDHYSLPPPKGGTDYISSVQLWSSCWSGLHPLWLFGLRFASLVIMFGFLVWDIVVYDASIFVYYTEWAFTLVIIYFAIGTIISGHGCFLYHNSEKFCLNEKGQTDMLLRRDIEMEDSSSISSEALLLQQRAGFWGYLMQTLYQTCAGAVVLTDIVFWCLIVPFMSNTRSQLNLLMGCMHVLNAAFLLLESAVNSLPFPWFRLAYFVLLSCCYVVFQWVIHAVGYSMWPYPFLVLSSPWAPLWYVCLAGFHIPCYGVYYWLIVIAKRWVLCRFLEEACVVN